MLCEKVYSYGEGNFALELTIPRCYLELKQLDEAVEILTKMQNVRKTLQISPRIAMKTDIVLARCKFAT